MEIHLTYRDRFEKGVKINRSVHLERSVDEFEISNCAVIK